MDVTTVALDKAKAEELYNEYKAHRHYSTPIDDEIRKAYKAISQGKVVIQALESIKRAGLNEQGLPKLAIARAVEPACILRTNVDGSCTMAGATWARGRGRADDRVEFPKGSFRFPVLTRQRGPQSAPRTERYTMHGRAAMPLIPIHLRPKQAIQTYHVLWEAEWTPVPPVDPYLLRRIGQADLWLVVAAWDLTPVERAALATRVSVQ